MDSGSVADEQTRRPIPDAAAAEGWHPPREALARAPYIPPVDLLLEGLGIAEPDLDRPTVSVSTDFLRFLLSELARGAPFDAAWYDTQYPDLREGGGDGVGPEWLHEHFITQGYFEARLPHEPSLDAEWYFRHYRDVWAEYSQKLQEVLREHFLTQGYVEGRAGAPSYADAADRWIEAARRMGPAVMRRIGKAAAETAAETAPETFEPPEPGPATGAAHLLMRDFESLGWNCEFGLVQRHFSVEPISLLAFSTIPFGRLCGALGTKFATFGQQEEMKIAVHEQEYCLLDPNNEFSKHTWIYQGAADPDELLKREGRKLNFLKAKLVRELQTGSKIFVFKKPPGFSEAHVSELYYELLSYGDNMLFWVDEQDDLHRAGDIELLFGRLYKGYVDKFSPVERAAADISYDAWFEVCTKAHRLWGKPLASAAANDGAPQPGRR